MISTYDFQVEHPEIYSHLLVKDSRFLHYKNPQQKKIAKLYIHFNKFIVRLGVKKMIYQFTNSCCKKNVNELAVRIGSAISKTKYHQPL